VHMVAIYAQPSEGLISSLLAAVTKFLGGPV
jgi:hypothetical protein